MHRHTIQPLLSTVALALLLVPACDSGPSGSALDFEADDTGEDTDDSEEDDAQDRPGDPQEDEEEDEVEDERSEGEDEESGTAPPEDAPADDPPADPQDEDLPPARPDPDKDTATMSIPDDLSGAQLVIKFVEGSDVQQDGGLLLSDAPTEMDITDVETDLVTVMENCESIGVSIKPLFGLSREVMTEIKIEGESNTGQGLADLSLYFNADLFGASKEALLDLLVTLNGLDSVEIAYIQPAPQVASVVSPPDAYTPDFAQSQGYVADDANGIHRSAAWARPGGRGEYARIMDVEGAWVEDHEDLPFPFYFGGNETSNIDWINHGTAVAGVLSGQENGFGVTGIVPYAPIGYTGIFGPAGTAGAILDAANQLDPGDILLVEVQFGGPQTVQCTCNEPQCNSVPVEYYQAEFDAIQAATAKGIIVVEAGGNGSVNLDDPRYEGRFDRRVRDSGAILVGASVSYARQPACFTNYGSRIDIHAWGENVVTLGYGDGYQGQLGERDKYTRTFGGTSSASPIVVGAIAALQSIAYTVANGPMTAREVLTLLQTTGSAQDPATTSRFIGPMPNLEAAIASLGW